MPGIDKNKQKDNLRYGSPQPNHRPNHRPSQDFPSTSEHKKLKQNPRLESQQTEHYPQEDIACHNGNRQKKNRKNTVHYC